MQLGMIFQPTYLTKIYLIKSLLAFQKDEEQNKAQMAPLVQELKNLRTEMKEHRLNALEGNQKPFDPNKKGRQNATRFCGYCRTNSHSPSYCRKRERDEEVKKLQNEATAEKNVTSTQDYNKRRVPSHGCGLDQMNWQDVVKFL